MNIVVLIILILLNAFFASSEIAFISMNEYELAKNTKLKNNLGKKSRRISRLLENPSKFLSLIQVGVTLAGFLASAKASTAFADDLANVMANIFTSVSITVLHNISMVLITIILSLATLIFGELVPKRVAMASPEKIAYKAISVLYVLNIIFAPIIIFLTKSTDFIAKLLRVPEKEDEAVTEDTLVALIMESKKAGKIEKNEGTILKKVFKMNDILVQDIMTPYKKVVAIDVNAKATDILKLIEKTKYTRIPVFDKEKKNIIGIVHNKDILLKLYKDKKNFNIKEVMRKVNKAKENEIIDDVLLKLRKSKIHLAVIEDENKKMVGIVTLEDILEELVGEIYDEYDTGNKDGKIKSK